MLKEVFQEIASINFEDGLTFDPGSVSAKEIVEQDEYHGIRIKLSAKLGTARQQVQIDIGFGDVIYPDYLIMDYPTLLDFETPHFKVYSLESAIAEKFEALLLSFHHFPLTLAKSGGGSRTLFTFFFHLPVIHRCGSQHTLTVW